MTVTNGIDVTTSDAFAEITLSRFADGLWLSAAQRAALLAELASLEIGRAGVLLRAADRVMARHADGGPDLPSPDDQEKPTMADLCRAIEQAPVPVFVLLEGMVAGAGAELALAARWRIATPGASIAFSAGRLGRISGAGGTQRLPHLVGAEHALRLLIQSRPIPAPEALVIGLVDQIVEADTQAEIVAAARAWAQANARLMRKATGTADAKAYLQAIKAVRATAAPDSLAMALADCTEAALLLPAEQGLALEATLAAERDAMPRTLALAHMARAERRAAQMPEALQQIKAGPVVRPALVGASPQMTALALMALVRGLAVTVLEPDRNRLVAMLQTIASRQEAAVQGGTLSAAQRDADWARLRTVVDAAEIARADLVIVASDTAVPESRPAVPLLVMGRGPLPEGALRLVVWGRVAELGLPANCPAAAAVQAMAFLRRLGQTVVLTGVQSPLGISGRLAGAGAAALRALQASGVPPDAIRAALVDFGVPAPAMPQAELGPLLRLMQPQEIVNRWLGALANEGARILASGLAQSASDIDLVAVFGLGLPAESGGPMYQAEQRGLMILRRDLVQWAAEAEVWRPVPALDALVSAGRGFSGRLSQG
ncbi:enoyl-CoA hydratase-related protein [Pseudotabrizicola algicola]|uniref:3-hydroxyacyl-CoA dehydrogenase NAD binding domain-containing protein n=1 Tax=Pseudotabrizicola algicola TaxID=2709381 RepID=A0A6B3RFS7_9RHOB|nr:enoyl-CoA hydratase-related protein [Pseudotabrizicola algicola]NEX44800.1 hypothetical protein [Pseudotabrizicola algicola]